MKSTNLSIIFKLVWELGSGKYGRVVIQRTHTCQHCRQSKCQRYILESPSSSSSSSEIDHPKKKKYDMEMNASNSNTAVDLGAFRGLFLYPKHFHTIIIILFVRCQGQIATQGIVIMTTKCFNLLYAIAFIYQKPLGRVWYRGMRLRCRVGNELTGSTTPNSIPVVWYVWEWGWSSFRGMNSV